ncbi:MAG: hypothetical protein BWY82_02985 [Verrucomicrobia bacterium ADurb.Bin474]|nr:MAG: hypothetical protein BWY82_02985 [Verrucomicrobia bacterium ADurb.Bin474]
MVWFALDGGGFLRISFPSSTSDSASFQNPTLRITVSRETSLDRTGSGGSSTFAGSETGAAFWVVVSTGGRGSGSGTSETVDGLSTIGDGFGIPGLRRFKARSHIGDAIWMVQSRSRIDETRDSTSTASSEESAFSSASIKLLKSCLSIRANSTGAFGSVGLVAIMDCSAWAAAFRSFRSIAFLKAR